jgi:hypothetical protein
MNHNFAGFAREIFTDTGVYTLRMDLTGLEEEAARKIDDIKRTAKMRISHRAYQETIGKSENKINITLNQKAVILITAVTIDFDYFSRHSSGNNNS